MFKKKFRKIMALRKCGESVEGVWKFSTESPTPCPSPVGRGVICTANCRRLWRPRRSLSKGISSGGGGGAGAPRAGQRKTNKTKRPIKNTHPPTQSPRGAEAGDLRHLSRQIIPLPSLRGRGRGWGFLWLCSYSTHPHPSASPSALRHTSCGRRGRSWRCVRSRSGRLFRRRSVWGRFRADGVRASSLSSV